MKFFWSSSKLYLGSAVCLRKLSSVFSENRLVYWKSCCSDQCTSSSSDLTTLLFLFNCQATWGRTCNTLLSQCLSMPNNAFWKLCTQIESSAHCRAATDCAVFGLSDLFFLNLPSQLHSAPHFLKLTKTHFLLFTSPAASGHSCVHFADPPSQLLDLRW